MNTTLKSAARIGTSVLALSSLFAVDAMAQVAELEDEVIVTARRIEENLQEVPVAVTAFNAEQIFERGFQNIEDISRQTPGFVFDTPFGRQFDRPIIRGQANILGASGVSVFIDGVNVPQSIRSLNFGDVGQIEIIKGPQSALFGRNTYSGAINITTRRPTNDFSGELSANIGEFGYREFLGNVSIPIVQDKLFAALSGRIYDFKSEFDRDGNLNPSVGNESSETIGLKLTAYLNDNWETRFRANYNHDDDGHFPIGLLGFDDLNVNVPGGTDLGGVQPFFQGVVEAEGSNPSGSNQLSNTLGEGGGIEREELFLSLSNEVTFNGGYTIFNTLGYTKEDFRDELDSDGQPEAFTTARIFGPFPLGAPPAPFGVGIIPFDFTTTDDDSQETFVAELRLDSPADRAFRWRVGAYYFDNEREDRDLLERFEDGRFEQAALDSYNQSLREIAAALGQFFVVPLVPFSFGPTGPRDTQTVNEAIYGSLAYDFNDQLTVTAEGRYQEETISQQDGDFMPEAKFTAFTPRFTLDYQMTDDNLLYGVAARGTKPGGFNGEDADAVGFGTFDEETAWSFEIGSKNTFAGRRGTFNVAGFFTDLSGYQLTENLRSLGAGSASPTASAVANVGEVEIFGIELDTSYTFDLGAGFGTIGGSYAYTDAEFTEGSEATQGLVFGDSDLSGQTLPRQAPHQASGFLEYNTEIDNGLGLTGNLSGSYLSSRFAQVQNLAETGDSFELDGRITLNIGDTYSIGVYGKNLTNDDTPLGVLRFIDPIGVNSFTIGNSPIPSTFNLASAGQSRGFQYNNRHGRRFGVVLRAKW